jgi:hypothetical protein
MTQYGTAAVVTTGHSLGAALALLDAVYFAIQLPDAQLRTVVYGLPRVVDPAFAAWIDASPIALTHVNNMKDPGALARVHWRVRPPYEANSPDSSWSRAGVRTPRGRGPH